MTYAATDNGRVRRGWFAAVLVVCSAAAAAASGCVGPAGAGEDPGGGDSELNILTQEATTAPSWKLGARYKVGALVRYEGIVYECRQAHRAIVGWQPPRTPALWQRPTPVGLAAWTNQTHYVVGSRVTFAGKTWSCRQEHVSQVDWTPTVTPSLWLIVNQPPPNRPPVVTILSPADRSHHVPGAAITFRAQVTDPDDPAPFSGQVVWSSDVDGAVCEGLTCQSATLRGGPHVITVKATDAAGASAVASVAIVVNSPPNLEIILPPEGAAFRVGESVIFRAAASDPEQMIALGTLAWSSHLDGALGTGAEISSSTLSAGTHRITVTATDDLGAVGSASVQVLVAPPIGPPQVLIHEPVHGHRITAGSSVRLVGLGFDPEDGLLPDGVLRWSSDLDGALGTGPAVEVVLSGPTERCAPDRAHRITLTVTDSDGNTASFFVVVQVVASC